MTSLVIGSIFGLIAGGIWSMAVGSDFEGGVLPGIISGFGVGLIFYLLESSAMSGGKFQNRELKFATSSMMWLIFIVAVVLAIIVALIRWIM